jgi:hypothetical protein
MAAASPSILFGRAMKQLDLDVARSRRWCLVTCDKPIGTRTVASKLLKRRSLLQGLGILAWNHPVRVLRCQIDLSVLVGRVGIICYKRRTAKPGGTSIATDTESRTACSFTQPAGSGPPRDIHLGMLSA